MAIARNNLPKEMTPFGKGAKKAKPFGGEPKKTNPFGGKSKAGDMKAAPFSGKEGGKKPKPFGFAGGGSIPAEDSPTHKAAMASNPPTNNPLDDGKPSGGGQARGGGAATKGKKFLGTF
jgi:hypothetical protein